MKALAPDGEMFISIYKVEKLDVEREIKRSFVIQRQKEAKDESEKIRSTQRVKYYEGREAKDFKTVRVDVDELCQLLMN